MSIEKEFLKKYIESDSENEGLMAKSKLLEASENPETPIKI